MKIDPVFEKELTYLLKFVQKREDAYIQDMQEYIFTLVYLITNPKFRSEVAKLREKYSIPLSYDADDKDFYKWLYGKKPSPPADYNSKEIRDICLLCKVNPRVMGDFVYGYLYFGDVVPMKPYDDISINAKDDLRFKCKLEALTLDYNTIPREDMERGYIRFYKDTKIKGILNFIDANKDKIREIQKGLKPYPYTRTKRYINFKRDFQVYLLFLLGTKRINIASEYLKINVPENADKASVDKFSLNDSIVYEIIDEMQKRLKTFS